MPTHKWSDLRQEAADRDPDFEEKVAAERDAILAEIGLHELRRRRALSQAALAAELGITQSAVSQLERSNDPRLSTISDYIEGLGGTLRLEAVFEDGTTYTLALGESVDA